MSALRLITRDARASAREIPLDEGAVVTLGRDPECEVRLDARRVSGRHAVVRRQGGTVTVEDLRAPTGIRVNGEVVGRAELTPGDKLDVGGVVFELAGPGSSDSSSSPELLLALAGLLAGVDRDLSEQLGEVLDHLLAALGADRGAVLVPGEGGELEPRVTRTRAGAAVDEATPVSRRLLAAALESREVALLSEADTAALREDFTSIPGEVRSILVTSLPLPESPGVLYLDGAGARRRFQESDADLVRAFAEAVGLALGRERDRRLAAQFAGLQRRDLEAEDLVAGSPAMRGALGELEQAAGADVTVLITGETGTGKELAARLLHRGSARAGGPFVSVHCAAIPPELVESELFGHEKGAFSGATSLRKGRFELAHGGTLFLDEVGDIPAKVQPKLLRALQERRITRVGGSRELPVDFRLVSATHVDLEAAVSGGSFREDLLYRVAVMRIALPPLRDRGDDVLAIARHYLARFAREHRRALAGFTPEAEKLLVAHAWPGNIRELRNLVEQAVVREEGPAISAAALRSGLSLGEAPRSQGDGLSMGALPVDISEARREFDRAFLVHQLTVHGGNMTRTAEAIGLARRNLYARCQDLGIDYGGFR